MIRMSGPDPWILLGGLLPQEADRRCDFVGVDGVNVAGVDSLVGGDVSTSRQDTDGDFMCFVSLESRLLTGEGKSKRLSLSPTRLVREELRPWHCVMMTVGVGPRGLGSQGASISFDSL